MSYAALELPAAATDEGMAEEELGMVMVVWRTEVRVEVVVKVLVCTWLADV